jgi:hypothetical protein
MSFRVKFCRPIAEDGTQSRNLLSAGACNKAGRALSAVEGFLDSATLEMIIGR